jgi:hypothetical protein
MILPISAFQVARITVVGHWHIVKKILKHLELNSKFRKVMGFKVSIKSQFSCYYQQGTTENQKSKNNTIFESCKNEILGYKYNRIQY